jgi:hypothetical protein
MNCVYGEIQLISKGYPEERKLHRYKNAQIGFM